MALTDSQIERYSRQIIVPGVGGRGQERLLATCVAIVAAPTDAASALAYLGGAGVGRIVMHPVGDRSSYDTLFARIGDLNTDVSIGIACDTAPARCDLILALVGDARTTEAAARLWRTARTDAQSAREHRYPAAIVARLDTPGRIAILPEPPPCPLCAEADLLSPPGARSADAGAITMVAVAEAFRMLAGVARQHPEAVLVEFDGYVTRARALHQRRPLTGGAAAGIARCVCETRS